MTKGKAIRQRYNQILKDKDRRIQHFGPGGALGNEKEGRDIVSRMNVDEHNMNVRSRQITDYGVVNQDAEKKVDELKKGKKITLTRM